MLDTAKLTIRKNDMVQVIAGRDKGKTGKVLNVDSKNGKVLIEKLNLVKRHVRPTQDSPTGGVTEKEAPIHYSNVLLFCSKCDKGVRHGIQVVENKGKQNKVRVCKKCKEKLGQA